MHRIESIDTCRGIMLFLMMLTHLYTFPFISIDYLEKYTHEFLGFFTDPEGFFFLSGLVAGIVYGRYYIQGKEKEGDARILRRTAQLYFWQNVIFVVICLGLSLSDSYVANWKTLHNFVPEWIGNEGILFFLDHPWTALSMGVFFLHLPPFLDILPVFVLFLAITPLVLRQLQKGQLRWVIGVSIACWAAEQLIPGRIFENALKTFHPQICIGWFDALAWQLLFVAGLTFGFLKVQGRLPKPTPLLTFQSIILAIVFFYLKHFGPDLSVAANIYLLGPFRVLSFGAFACVIWSFNRFLAWRPFSLLGRHSLPVFVYHVILVYFLVAFFEEINGLSFIPKFTLLLLCALSIWIPAYYAEWRKTQKQVVQSAR